MIHLLIHSLFGLYFLEYQLFKHLFILFGLFFFLLNVLSFNLFNFILIEVKRVIGQIVKPTGVRLARLVWLVNDLFFLLFLLLPHFYLGDKFDLFGGFYDSLFLTQDSGRFSGNSELRSSIAPLDLFLDLFLQIADIFLVNLRQLLLLIFIEHFFSIIRPFGNI